ncbi:NAD-dependent epimerase/dehydratase family protein [Candidatus Venteria ishoeyi]|uniref:NAD dependent epimerase/dehydratase family protein n=1 Tax=Candidatus Venteria ishoeyi TaxID=1899563 RepID=A0A1H6F551_9GAMM|nr:NAD-dependent epimerase/dehydratase family protein [Candidatus Venteria ishoeyi]MDM8547705.1 NAD-dependent epimerase/dehydratase family protein [Candidatus Venteria ishoeyi]SEH04399.1 NAD dependent epimerase/dehydratase family protein [Candidatus Venteria ishoeyi]
MKLQNEHPILLTGASSQIGRFLLPQLLDAGYQVMALSRRPKPDWVLAHPRHEACHWINADLNTIPKNLPCKQAEILLHLAPITLLPELLEHLPDLQRLIAFSSTSRFCKLDSSDPGERDIANALIDAESVVVRLCDACQVRWTLFRPTLIYGCNRDKNVYFITQFIQRFHFFPVLAPANGKRQPVHAEDLAIACIQALNHPHTALHSYNLSGGETLTYKEMVARIFQATGQPTRILAIPAWLFRSAITVLRLFPKYRHISSAMMERMNEPLYYPHIEATRDFDYKPRGFTPPKDTD